MEDTVKEKTITIFVNGEPEAIGDRDITLRMILEAAGFTPVEDYTLKSENPPLDFGTNYDEVIKVHPNQRFQALFGGVTPVS